MRCDEGRDLKTGIKRQHAGALVLWFIVACGGGGAVANGQGGVGAAAVTGVDISGTCGTDGAGIVNDVCIAVAVVVNGVIFIVEVQSRVSGCEVGAEEVSVGGRAC